MKTYLQATSNLPCYRALLASCFLKEPSIVVATTITIIGPLVGFSRAKLSVHFAHLHRLASFIEVTREVGPSHVTIGAGAGATRGFPSNDELPVALTGAASVRSAISAPLSATN